MKIKKTKGTKNCVIKGKPKFEIIKAAQKIDSLKEDHKDKKQ